MKSQANKGEVSDETKGGLEPWIAAGCRVNFRWISPVLTLHGNRVKLAAPGGRMNRSAGLIVLQDSIVAGIGVRHGVELDFPA